MIQVIIVVHYKKGEDNITRIKKYNYLIPPMEHILQCVLGYEGLLTNAP